MNDEEFEQELSGLYRAALLDEHFQQQVSKDLQTLQAEARTSLKVAEQVFVEEEEPLSAEVRTRLLEKMRTPAKADVAQGKSSWWQKWFGRGSWENSFLPGPGFSIPAAMMAGVVLGVLLPAMLSAVTKPAFLGRGGGGQPVEMQPASPPEEGITDAIRQDPQQWLNAIAELVRQGKVAEARAELGVFDTEYPGYLPK